METPFVPVPRTNPLTKWWPVLVGMLVFVALVSLSLSLIYVNRQQDVRQQAATPSTTMTLKWRGRTDGNKLVVDVLMNTKDFAVAGAELHGTIDGVKSGSVVISTSNPLGLQPVLTELVDQSGNATDFNVTLFAPLSTNQPVNTKNAEQVITSFTISNVPSSGITVRFDGSTKVPAISHPEATLEISGSQNYTLGSQNTETSDASKKSCNQNCATDTECQSAFQCYKGQCRVKGDLEDASCKKIADNGLQRNCNQYCANGGECQSQYVCYFNQCRNPRNITNSNCAEAPSPTPKTTTTGSKGSGVGGRVTVSPSPTPKPVIAKVTFVSPSPSASASARPSVSPTATISARASASPTLFSSPKVSPRPASPAPTTTTKSGGAGRTVLAVVAILSGLALFGFSLYKLFKR